MKSPSDIPFLLLFSFIILIYFEETQAEHTNSSSWPNSSGNIGTRLSREQSHSNSSARMKFCNINCSNLTHLESIENHDCTGTTRNNCTRNENMTIFDCRPRRRNGHILNCRLKRTKKVPKEACLIRGFAVKSIRLIQDGVTVNASAWPWHVSIFRHPDNSPPTTVNSTPLFVCSGTLISPSKVLTAAHCVTDKFGRIFPITTYEIVVGADSSDIQEARQQDSAQILKVLFVNISTNYNVFTYDSDIAVISISKVKLSRSVYPICVPKNDVRTLNISSNVSFPTLKIGFTIGFGINQFFGVSKKLKEALVPLVDKSTCENAGVQILSESQFCGGDFHGALICQGNSGAGLFTHLQASNSSKGLLENFVLEGIVSHAAHPNVLTYSGESPRCIPRTYTVFTKVSHFVHWIQTFV